MAIIIIGHGQSINLFDDKLVDSFDTVIRFANYPKRLGCMVGKKTDILVEKHYDSGSIINCRLNPRNVWITAGKFSGEIVETTRKRLEAYNLVFGFEIETYNHRYGMHIRKLYEKSQLSELEILNIVDSGLSRGTQAIIMACSRLRDDVIVLAGFDTRKGIHGPHHMDFEMSIRQEVAKKCKKRLIYCVSGQDL